MFFKRFPTSANVIKNNGETVYELLTNEHKLPFGVAVVDLKQSKLHYHEKTWEMYYGLKGYGELELIDERGQISVAPIEKNSLQVIPPKVKHVARALKLEEAYSEIDLPFRALVISFPPWSEEDHYLVEE